MWLLRVSCARAARWQPIRSSTGIKAIGVPCQAALARSTGAASLRAWRTEPWVPLLLSTTVGAAADAGCALLRARFVAPSSSYVVASQVPLSVTRRSFFTRTADRPLGKGLDVAASACRFVSSAPDNAAAAAAVGSSASPGAAAEVDEVAAGIEDPLRTQVEDRIHEINVGVLKVYDTKFNFVSDSTNSSPMVMLLGNHSSGKSTLINYLLGCEVQRTGVAPTDDGFTVILRDTYDSDDEGPAAVANPKYQLQGLQQFGCHFISRFKVKTRRLPQNRALLPFGVMVVDTPGMIDTPVHVQDRSTLSGQLRGYDFLAATRWFAQRADVILLMFDPANPGTTGETLDVLTKSLAGYEHKFLLVMNKVDLFEKMTDFARAYGALCWNLSKVIPMKDIPQIFTTCTPSVSYPDGEGAPPTVALRANAAPGTDGGVPPEEMRRQHEEIITEILKAPLRRLDNIIAESEEGAKRLLLAGQVCTALRREYNAQRVKCFAVIGTFFVALPMLALALVPMPISSMVITTLMSVTLTGGSLVVASQYLRQVARDVIQNCDSQVGRLFKGKQKTHDIHLRWHAVVRPEIMQLVKSISDTEENSEAAIMSSLPSLSERARREIETIIKEEFPRLRLAVASYKENKGKAASPRPSARWIL